MPTWKKNIFVRVVQWRMTEESRTANDIIQEYVKLTDAEKAEILTAINAV